ncbi:hypothetical protein L596_000791 [Steinernema carpocapsae]|uniref:ATP-dependent RNA helicase n=1 Tax=Steinernema carpocapsae TaxID=34508 RepID=A0A4U8ULL3_STECR|nr:hypothetical protein L596_000791 [Steinernema carpocapsae]
MEDDEFPNFESLNVEDEFADGASLGFSDPLADLDEPDLLEALEERAKHEAKRKDQGEGGIDDAEEEHEVPATPPNTEENADRPPLSDDSDDEEFYKSIPNLNFKAKFYADEPAVSNFVAAPEAPASTQVQLPTKTFFNCFPPPGAGHVRHARQYLEMLIQRCRPYRPEPLRRVFTDRTNRATEPEPARFGTANGMEAEPKNDATIRTIAAQLRRSGVPHSQVELMREAGASGNIIGDHLFRYLNQHNVVNGMRQNKHTKEENNIKEGLLFQDLMEPDDIVIRGGDGTRVGVTFAALENGGFMNTKIVDNLKRMGVTKLTSIQQVVTKIMASKVFHFDMIAQAQPGSGKTTIYLAMIVAWIYNFKYGKLYKNRDNKKGVVEPRSPFAFIIVPSRELAAQISCYANELCRNLDIWIKVAVSYGEMDIQYTRSQMNNSDIVVGTPTRFMSSFQVEYFNTRNLFWVVVDEADEVFKTRLGDEWAIHELLGRLKALNQVRLYAFGSTISEETVTELKEFMRPNPFEVHSRVMPTTVKHFFMETQTSWKRHVLCCLLNVLRNDGKETPKTLIFVENQMKCEYLYHLLHFNGFPCLVFHKTMYQFCREFVLDQFATGVVKILISTDIAGRGLNFAGLKYVINYDLPNETNQFIHRSGAAGRIGNLGTVISLIEVERPGEYERVSKLIPVLRDAGIHPAAIMYYYDMNTKPPQGVLYELQYYEDTLEAFWKAIAQRDEGIRQEQRRAAERRQELVEVGVERTESEDARVTLDRLLAPILQEKKPEKKAKKPGA